VQGEFCVLVMHIRQQADWKAAIAEMFDAAVTRDAERVRVSSLAHPDIAGRGMDYAVDHSEVGGGIVVVLEATVEFGYHGRR